MKTLYKITLASAMALSLAGTATALAQTTTVQGHAAYVTLTKTTTPDETHATIEGTVACEATTTERIARALANRPACAHDAYAYAHPHDAPPPWEGTILWVNETHHQAPDGTLLHAATITYEIMTLDEGPETIHATATELRPHDRTDHDTHATYSVPIPTNDGETPYTTVTIGPTPQPTIDGETLSADT